MTEGPGQPLRSLMQVVSSHGAKLYLTLRAIGSRNGERTAQVTMRDLGEFTHLRDTIVRNAVHELIELGVMERIGQSTYRFLTCPRPWLDPKLTVGSPLHPPVLYKTKEKASKSKDSIPERIGGDRRGGLPSTLASTAARVAKHRASLFKIHQQAAGRLGLPAPNLKESYTRAIHSHISRQLRNGYSESDLLTVVEWGLTRWHQDQFPPNRDLLYLWGKRFPFHLATAGIQAGPKSFRTGGDMTKWHESARRIAERPLTPPTSGGKPMTPPARRSDGA